ncbi:MAG TPA: type VI secretion system baseplate subunit TssG, partial [Puia sp.]|nr:type VI secretion system baseplate subunit TssG [Puia sp.]
GLERGMLHRYFREFWDLPREIDDTAAGYLILLIPYAHRIAGHLLLMQQCLELLLGEDTEVRIVPPQPTLIDRQMEKGLGEQSLGDDTVCGSSFMEGYPAYEYIIGPLDQDKVKEYLPGGHRYLIIETFNRFFVPAHASVNTQIEIDRQTAEMKLEPGKEPLLGYSSLLMG